MSRSSNDDRSDSMNPNNSAYDDGVDNRSNQLNPNNGAYRSSRDNHRDEYREDDSAYRRASRALPPFGSQLIAGMSAPELEALLNLTIYYVDCLGNSKKAWVTIREKQRDFRDYEDFLQSIERKTRSGLEQQSSICYLRVECEKSLWVFGGDTSLLFEAKLPSLSAEPHIQEMISASIEEIEEYRAGRVKPIHLWKRGDNYDYKDFMQKVLGAKDHQKP